jgi:hypothetical protein
LGRTVQPNSSWVAQFVKRHHGRSLNSVVSPHENGDLPALPREHHRGARQGMASPAHPTQCRACGGLSHIANPYGTSASRAITFVPLAGAVVLFTSVSWRWAVAVVAALFIGIVAYEVAAFYRTPMVATTAEGVAVSRHWERVGLAILWVGAAVVVVALWGSRAG